MDSQCKYINILGQCQFNNIQKFSKIKQNLFIAVKNGKQYFCKFHQEDLQYKHEIQFLKIVSGKKFTVSQYIQYSQFRLICTIFISKQTLESFCKEYKQKLKERFTRISTVIINRLEALRQQKISHFDLNLSNIVGFSLQIVGFSGFQIIDQYHAMVYQNLMTNAPQCYASYLYHSQSVQIFYLGVILFMLYFGKYPFDKNKDRIKQLQNIKTDGYWKKLQQQSKISEQLKKIFKDILQANPTKRPTLNDLKQSKQLYQKDFDQDKENKLQSSLRRIKEQADKKKLENLNPQKREDQEKNIQNHRMN